MIADEDFTWAMKEAVAERGADYVYPKEKPGFSPPGVDSCVYQTPGGEPACLIGLAMSKLGLKLPEHELIETASPVLSGHASKRVRFAAEIAQSHQDAGGTWGSALDVYLENL